METSSGSASIETVARMKQNWGRSHGGKEIEDEGETDGGRNILKTGLVGTRVECVAVDFFKAVDV